jgi:hypothetical protein
MAKRSRPPTTFGPSVEIGGPYVAHIEAKRKRVFDEWSKRLGDRPLPTNRELRSYCKYLINRPHLIEGPHAPYIFLVLQGWFAKTRPPKLSYTGKQIADLVDWVSETEKIPLSQAYEKVSEAFHISFEGVKQNHLRHRKSKRDKSR